MAQNGVNRRSNNPATTRTYPGMATRLLTSNSTASSSSSSGSTGGNNNISTTWASIPSVLVRPLSHSQLSSPGPRNVSNEAAPVPPARPISLDQPRPSTERHRNLYMGAPLPSHNNRLNTSSSNSPNSTPTISPVSNTSATAGNNLSANKLKSDSTITAAEQVRLPTNSRLNNIQKNLPPYSDNNKLVNKCSQDSSAASVVTCQPKKSGPLVEEPPQKVKPLAESSIICPNCRKCRCEACATPRALPSKWICSKSVHCGPEPLLDYVTCLCCVKAIFYHCGKNHEPDGGVMCADKPCSCAPHRKFWRWGCMSAMSLVLPCLCLYWPCKGCVRLVEKGYQKYHNNGCTCRLNHPHHPHNNHEQNGAMNSLNRSIVIIGESSEDEDHHKKHQQYHQKRIHNTIGDFSKTSGGSSQQISGKISKLLPTNNKTTLNN